MQEYIKKEKDIPHVFYLYLHSKIFEKSKGEDIKINEVISYMFQWSIPKQLRYLIIKEMEKLDLLKVTNKYMIELNKPQFNEEDIGKYYCELSIF
jgi:hypothetical protein